MEEFFRNNPCTYLSLDEFAQIDVVGCAVLHEQGQIVIRAIISGYEQDEERWAMQLKYPEQFMKWANIWIPDDFDEGSGPVKYLSIRQYFEDKAKTNKTFLEVSCYGSLYVIAPKCANPWQEISWPVNMLDTEAFKGGIMEPEKLAL